MTILIQYQVTELRTQKLFNSYDRGPMLSPFKLHSIVSKDNVNPVSVDLGNTDCVGPVLGPSKLLPINPETVNP